MQRALAVGSVTTRLRDALRLKKSSSARDLSAVARTTCSSEPEKAAYRSVSGGCALFSPRPLWSPPNCGAGPRHVTVAVMNTVVGGLVMVVWAHKGRTTHWLGHGNPGSSFGGDSNPVTIYFKRETGILFHETGFMFLS